MFFKHQFKGIIKKETNKNNIHVASQAVAAVRCQKKNLI